MQIDVLISGCGIVIRVDELGFSTYLTVLRNGRQSAHISFCTSLPSTPPFAFCASVCPSTRGMDKWKQKDPYETISEYKERVNEETARVKQEELQKILMEQRFMERQ